MPGCPTLDSLNQMASDSLPLRSLVNDQTANLHPVVRLQEMRKRSMDPASQPAVGRLSHVNHVAGTGEQS